MIIVILTWLIIIRTIVPSGRCLNSSTRCYTSFAEYSNSFIKCSNSLVRCSNHVIRSNLSSAKCSNCSNTFLNSSKGHLNCIIQDVWNYFPNYIAFIVWSLVSSAWSEIIIQYCTAYMDWFCDLHSPYLEQWLPYLLSFDLISHHLLV